MPSPADVNSEVDDCDSESLSRNLEGYAEQRQTEIMISKEKIFAPNDLKVTITFSLDSGKRYTSAFNYTTSFAAIKDELSQTFRTPAKMIMIFMQNREVRDYQTPSDLGAEPFDSLELRVQSRDPNNWPLRSKQLFLPTPDILTVLVDNEKEVVVEVEDRTIRKPFLGGYKNKITGIEYHHASSQATPVRQRGEQYSRDTQTAATKHKSTETPCNVASQTGENAYQFQSLLIPGTYVPYQPLAKRESSPKEHEAAACIQRNYRAHRCRRSFAAFLKSKREETSRDAVRAKAREEQDDKRMAYPRTRADFDMLYAMVDRWRKAQTDRISQIKTEAPRKAELCIVLEKEIKLLESIEAHRIRMLEEQRKEREKRFLRHISQPVTWTGYRGLKISMDTIRTQRARELASIYNDLCVSTPSPERIERLMALKHAIANQKGQTVCELIDLIDREAECLVRGIPNASLHFLRARIQQMFLRYLQETEPAPPRAEPNLFCRQCRKMRPRKTFCIASRDTDVAVCGACSLTKGEAHNYRYILRAVRRDEQRKNCYSSCAFVMTEEDMEFLVTSIWHGRSIISAVDDLRVLRMPRWDSNQDWTPWNCVLLTERETHAHVQVPPTVQYGEHILCDIAAKHELAKMHFAQLNAVDVRLRDSGVWANVVDDD